MSAQRLRPLSNETDGSVEDNLLAAAFAKAAPKKKFTDDLIKERNSPDKGNSHSR